MGVLQKALLQEISSDPKPKEIGPAVPVQFNPNTLRLKLSNQIEGGQTRGRQARQFIGKSSTSLTLELVFDTADEGTTERPRSVRERTAIVEKFVLPKKDGKEVVPKLRFSWGGLVIDGLVNSIDIDFDLFASDGTPLRAKVNLTIQEQDSRYEYLKAGPGSNPDGGAPNPGEASSTAPGQTSPGPVDQVAQALAGETAPDFAARMGLDPTAWRGLGVDLSAGLNLSAGVEVGFSASLGVGLGIGAGIGIEAGLNVSVEAAIGLDVGVDVGVQAGFALSAAGGVAAAAQAVEISRASVAAESARAAFEAPGGTTAAPPTSGPSAARSPQSRTPLAVSGPRTQSQQAAARAAPVPDRVDPRASSFGFGVPLRPRLAAPSVGRRGLVQGQTSTAAAAPVGSPAFRDDPVTPPWVALPRRDPGRSLAVAAEDQRRPRKPCGCQGRCHHSGA